MTGMLGIIVDGSAEGGWVVQVHDGDCFGTYSPAGVTAVDAGIGALEAHSLLHPSPQVSVAESTGTIAEHPRQVRFDGGAAYFGAIETRLATLERLAMKTTETVDGLVERDHRRFDPANINQESARGTGGLDQRCLERFYPTTWAEGLPPGRPNTNQESEAHPEHAVLADAERRMKAADAEQRMKAAAGDQPHDEAAADLPIGADAPHQDPPIDGGAAEKPAA